MGDSPRHDVILTCNYSPWSSYLGGGQKSTHMVATALAALGLKVCVIWSKAPWERLRVPAGLPYDIRWAFFFGIRPGISSPLRFLNGISYFFAARRLSGPKTILHGNGEEACLLGYIRDKRKFVFSHRYPGYEEFLRGSDWSRPWTWVRIFLREPRYVAMALTLRKAETVFCTSADSARRLGDYFGTPREKIRVVPNGIDPAFFAGANGRAVDGGSGILFFGRLTRAKGVEELARAYAALPESLRARHGLTLIGEGPFAGDLQSLGEKLGIAARIKRIPWMAPEGLVREIAASKLVVLPSHEESFGNTMLETLAAGRRLLTTDAGSIPEVVGEHAVKVPAGDARALGAEMARLLETDADPEAARRQVEYVRGRYSWEGSARLFLEAYGAR